MTFLLHLPYSNVIGVILDWLDTSVRLLGGRFHLLAHSRVRCEQNKLFIVLFFLFFLNKGTHARPYVRSHKTRACIQICVCVLIRERVIRGACTLLLSTLAIRPRGSLLSKQERVRVDKGARVLVLFHTRTPIASYLGSRFLREPKNIQIFKDFI